VCRGRQTKGHGLGSVDGSVGSAGHFLGIHRNQVVLDFEGFAKVQTGPKHGHVGVVAAKQVLQFHLNGVRGHAVHPDQNSQNQHVSGAKLVALARGRRRTSAQRQVLNGYVEHAKPLPGFGQGVGSRRELGEGQTPRIKAFLGRNQQPARLETVRVLGKRGGVEGHQAVGLGPRIVNGL